MIRQGPLKERILESGIRPLSVPRGYLKSPLQTCLCPGPSDNPGQSGIAAYLGELL